MGEGVGRVVSVQRYGGGGDGDGFQATKDST